MEEYNLTNVVTIFRAMSDRRVEAGAIYGKVLLSSGLRSDLNKAVELGWLFDTQYRKTPDDQELELELSVPRGQGEFFAIDWGDLLSHHGFYYEKPKAFFVASDEYFSEEKKETFSSKRYQATLSLIEVLREVADYSDISMDGGLKLIFLNQTKLEIPVIYSAENLRDVPKIKSLKDDIVGVNLTHKDQRKTIIKVILNEMLASESLKMRFVELLKKFPDFLQRYKDSYELYVAEFSFEKVLEEVNSHKLDYSIKLNKVFSDIQNQLLAVPAALILIGSKLTPKGYVEWQNSLTLLGCIIFVLFMDMLIRNQYNSLQAVLDEIEGQQQALIRRHPLLVGKFNDPYQELQKRHAHQKFLIRVVDGLVACMFLFCVVLYYWYSAPKFHWIKYQIETLFS